MWQISHQLYNLFLSNWYNFPTSWVRIGCLYFAMNHYFELNENGKTTYQNLWNAAKIVLQRKFMPLKALLERNKSLKLLI